MTTWLESFLVPVGPTMVFVPIGTSHNVPSKVNELEAGTIRFTGVAPTITGIADGSDGRRLVLRAVNSPLVLANENAGSFAANRIVTGTGGNVTIGQGGAALVVYDSTSGRWSLASGSGGGGGGSPGGSDGSVQIRSGSSFGGVSPGTTGNVLQSNGSAWISGPAPGGGGGGLTGWVSVTDHGAVGDGTTDDYAAFVAAIAAAGDGVVWVPPGTYRIASNLVIRRRVHIIGAGGVYRSDTSPTNVSTSRVVFDASRNITFDSNASSLGAGSALGSVVEHLALEQNAAESAGTHVVVQNARVIWRGCTIYGDAQGGHGWYVPPALNNEVTESAWYDCHAHNTGADGWHIETGNSHIEGGTAHDCAGKGVMIANVFGCSVVGTRLRGCGVAGGIGFQLTGPVGNEDGQGQHIAVGCGVSGGNGVIYLGASAMWIGGPSGAGRHASLKGLWLPTGAPWDAINVSNTRSAITINSTVGHQSTSQIAYLWSSSNDGNEFRLYYDEATNAQRWPLRYMGQSSGAVEFTAAGHAEGSGNLLLPRGMFLGNGGARRLLNYGSAAPTGASPRTSNNWAVGDIVLNNAGTTTKELLWLCTTAGNPGTWQAIYPPKRGSFTLAMGDANKTLTAAQHAFERIKATGTLTADRTIFFAVPASDGEGEEHTVTASVTGGNIVCNLVGSPGTTVTIAAGKTARIGTDTTGVYRVTADV